MYIGVTRTVGVAWVCRRFDHTPVGHSVLQFNDIRYRGHKMALAWFKTLNT